MADDLKFSHITVTSDEDEDVVIQAGAVSHAPLGAHAGAGAGGVDGASQTAQKPQAKPAQAAAFARAEQAAAAAKPAQTPADSAAAPSPSSASAHQVKPGTSEEPSARSKPAKKDGYHETTLEDIESVKMSTTQKAVIAVAVVGIIVFAVYYVMNFVL